MKSFLTNENLKFLLFGGKGGSGKTTSAAATGLYSAKTTKKKILIVSTDPAPSLGDSFDIEIGNKITQIEENLWAIEFDARELLEEFRKKNLEAIKILVERGTYLSQEDIEVFKNLAVPGMDEVMAIIKIADLLKTKAYDLIILDTAPTGHTKVLLSLPERMENWIAVMDLMQKKHRFLKKHWKGKYVKDECDRFLEETKADVTGVKNLLKKSELTEFVPVTIPEPMSILETEDLIEYLDRLGVNVKSIIANKILFPGGCDFCKKRAEIQEKYIGMIDEKFSAKGGSPPEADAPLEHASGGKKPQVLKMPLFPSEVRGKKDLLEYAEILFGKKEYKPSLAKEVLLKFPNLREAGMTNFLKKDLNFIICGGKGGVGKTVIAAGTAIALAEKHTDKKVLISTTDPAHALSKAFGEDIPLDAKEIPIRGFNNLFALEIDAQKMLKDRKDEYRKDIKIVFEKFVGPGIDVAFDKKVLEELMELSPPGLEELMALGKIMDLMSPVRGQRGLVGAQRKQTSNGVKEGKYDIYVLDSAASGHLLLFLELPEIVRGWLKSIFTILLKYRNIVGLVEIKRKLLDLSQNLKKIQETLFGSEKTEFVMISIAEEMGVREMKDLASSLEKLNLHYRHIVLNMINPVYNCTFCQARREMQEKYIAKVKKEYPEKEIVLVPLFPRDIRGIESLRELSKFLFG